MITAIEYLQVHELNEGKIVFLMNVNPIVYYQINKWAMCIVLLNVLGSTSMNICLEKKRVCL
jgi:hypothetical protein